MSLRQLDGSKSRPLSGSFGRNLNVRDGGANPTFTTGVVACRLDFLRKASMCPCPDDLLRATNMVGADKSARTALFSIEPELEHLRGLGLALTAIGEAADAIDPLAIAAIGRCFNVSIDTIRQAVRDGLVNVAE